MLPTLAPLHLYVHWPWCQQKCPYCDFNSHAVPQAGLADSLRIDYIKQVVAEIDWWRGQIAPERPLMSVFFGGGTPSLMTPAEVATIIGAARTLGAWQPTTEVTLEANPASLPPTQEEAYFQVLKGVGVNRLSLGVQGLREDWLQFLGRQHSVGGAMAALAAAQRVFTRVNADVIYGLPGQTLPDWQTFLQQLGAMGLSHISAYQLTIEPNTAFWGQVQRGAWAPVSADTEADFFDATRTTLGALGYENYEISNFAKPSEACRHNVGVWRGEDYIGVGAGAHGRLNLPAGQRLATATRKMPEAYVVADITTGPARFAVWDELPAAQVIQDAFFAGLRLQEGLCLTNLHKTHGRAVTERAYNTAALSLFTRTGWLEQVTQADTQWLRLTPAGWPLLSGLLKELLPPTTP